MKTAEEMFKQLGYEFEKEYTSDGVNDTYRYNRCFRVDSIIFDLNGKNIIVSKIFHTISLNELQAIIQQCKELGWNKEYEKMNEIKIPSIEFVRLKKGITEEELNDYIAENDDDSFLVYLRYKYDFEEEWTYSTECAAWNGCEDTISWLNDWYEGQQNVEFLAISKLGEEYGC